MPRHMRTFFHISDHGRLLNQPIDPSRVVTHTKYGIWDYYQEEHPDAGRITYGTDVQEGIPYITRAVRDVFVIPGCKLQVCIYAAAELAASLVPALSVWFQGQMLLMMEKAVETGEIDKPMFLLAFSGHASCSLITNLLDRVKDRAQNNINKKIQRNQALRAFAIWARIDLPTSERPDIMNELLTTSNSEMFGQTVLWGGVGTVVHLLGTGARVSTQVAVLWNVLRGQTDLAYMGIATILSELLTRLWPYFRFSSYNDVAWVVKTDNQDYLKIAGWKATVQSQKHRKEIVAGDLAEFAISEYTSASDRLGDGYRDFMEIQRTVGFHAGSGSAFWTHFQNGFSYLPQLAFAIRAMQNPSRMAELLATLHLIQSSAAGLAMSVQSLVGKTMSLGDEVYGLKKTYEPGIKNLVVDGKEPFVVDPHQGNMGIELEFRNVSFKYPSADKYALKDVSFKLLPGQLCVIVGSNGAGKSTILKLLVRLYDPMEGAIFFGGRDIRTLKMSDLRRATSVLFQDYTHFPLSIRDNIALGDPTGAHSDAAVRRAAELGGATKIIESLPEKYNTYLGFNNSQLATGPPDGSLTRSGKIFDTAAVVARAGLRRSVTQLSGGQMQRLAVARTFMRSVVREDARVGLLLFDEPSASLDPIAEHDLFDRLRELRGSKTMVFSSHRFGKLTRHADLILYMDGCGIIEAGTHEALLEKDGNYARLWKLQVQAFA
ncbi:HlyB/MsbA family ABC transporter [Epithele typhae]|uniref:HlyB/MsbA family ABC transporter n=1 Tax=Epithele typhae TaxID=378194 RepID=UPI00200861C6|nr:HlyB/MsbA family ABC transporter [Epithele typhae]KAH9941850.1 HlyB/MsbA family ABC transporter [Epithele typhae]